MRKLDNFQRPVRVKKVKVSKYRQCCRSEKWHYHLPDCPIGHPVINKQTDESKELWSEGIEVPTFDGNVL